MFKFGDIIKPREDCRGKYSFYTSAEAQGELFVFQDFEDDGNVLVCPYAVKDKYKLLSAREPLSHITSKYAKAKFVEDLSLGRYYVKSANFEVTGLIEVSSNEDALVLLKKI